MSSPIDVAVLVPFQELPGSWTDPLVRSVFAPARLVAVRACHRVVELLGLPEEEARPATHRSLTSVVLSTSLERAGLSWRVLDPGSLSLSGWRAWLEGLRETPPAVVAISSTFIVDGFWLATLCELVRRILPGSRIAVGGYYYATDTQKFLSVDADVLCVGEGERRIVQIVEALRDGRGLTEIPGLYFREGGHLRYTGNAEPLSLDELPLPDWSLAGRIEPPVDLALGETQICVETQRGCIFKCEYCTFRTLAAPVQASVERAVRAIVDVPGRGTLYVVDATATSPRDRWKRVLERLVEEGGSALPIEVFARVSDLDDEVCALMARAGVRGVRIGQESGDQRLLNAMRKGTRVDQVRPALAALARHGIRAFLSFIYGFPGETEESMTATRRLVTALNDGHEAAPVVQGVALNVFDSQSFSEVRQREALYGVDHRYGYGHLQVTPQRAAEVALETYLELSRIPHAPATAFEVGGFLWSLAGHGTGLRDPRGFFRWTKTVDRAIALFAEKDVSGARPGALELDRLRREILAGIPEPRGRLGTLRRARMMARHRATWLLLEEWTRGGKGTGPLTRLALAREAGLATGRLRDAYGALRTGKYPELGVARIASLKEDRAEAARLVQLGRATGRRRLAKSR